MRVLYLDDGDVEISFMDVLLRRVLCLAEGDVEIRFTMRVLYWDEGDVEISFYRSAVAEGTLLG